MKNDTVTICQECYKNKKLIPLICLETIKQVDTERKFLEISIAKCPECNKLHGFVINHGFVQIMEGKQ